jgi:son of sevenless
VGLIVPLIVLSSPQELPEGINPFVLTNNSFGGQSPRQRSQGRDPSSKVKKIFGDDAPSPPLIQKAPSINPMQDTAWFLKHDLEDDLAYDVKGQVKGGTLDALIERLTRHDMMDSTFNQTFLLTFKSFTTHEEFFDKIIGRYLPLSIVILL